MLSTSNLLDLLPCYITHLNIISRHLEKINLKIKFCQIILIKIFITEVPEVKIPFITAARPEVTIVKEGESYVATNVTPLKTTSVKFTNGEIKDSDFFGSDKPTQVTKIFQRSTSEYGVEFSFVWIIFFIPISVTLLILFLFFIATSWGAYLGLAEV